MPVSIVLDNPDTVLDEAGFSIVQLCKTAWETLEVTDVTYEPVSETVMLTPTLDPADTKLADVTTGVGSFAEFGASALKGKTTLLQQLVGPTLACWVETRKWYERNQGFVLRFYLYEPPPSFIGVFSIGVWFGGRYYVEIRSDGLATVSRASGREWDGESEPAFSYTSDAYEKIAEGPVLEDGVHLANQWHQLLLLPVKSDKILVKGGGDRGLVAREHDVLRMVSEDPDTGDEIHRNYTTFRAPVRVRVWGGAFALNVATPVWASSGSVRSGSIALGYTATQAPSAMALWEPRDGVDVQIQVLDRPSGVEFQPPASEFAYRLDLSSSEGQPAFLYDTRIRFDPTTRTRSPTAIDGSAYLLELRETTSLDAESARLLVAFDNASGVFNPKLNRCNVRAEVGVDGIRRFTGLTGANRVVPGAAPRWEVAAEDLYKKLRSARLSNAMIFDGEKHTDVMRALGRLAGFDDSEMVIAEDDYTLPSKSDDGDPLFQPRNGETVAEFAEYVRESFSGWRLYFDAYGILHYEPDPDSTPPPVAAFSTVTVPDGSAAPVFRLADEIDETGYANEVWVVGRDADGLILTAYFIDHASQNDPTCDRYVGERRLLVWIDTALATQEAVNWVCRTLAEEAIRFRRRVTLEAPFLARVHPGDVVTVDGEGSRIVSMDTVLAPSVSRTAYTVAPL